MELKAPYIIMGLGNPGTQFHKSRHNAGFCVIDAFIELYPPEEIKQTSKYWLAKCRIDGFVFFLVKPLTFMNLSGTIINDLKRKISFDVQHLIVITDNMDLDNGRLRLKEAGGSAGQKGLQNIIEQLGSNIFYRLYVGIGRPKPPMDVSSHVLSRFSPDEEPLFLAACRRAAVTIATIPQHKMVDIKQIFNQHA